MTEYEYFKLKAWREILQHVRDEFGDNRSVGNVLSNIDARIKGEEKRRGEGFRQNSVGMEKQEKPTKISKGYERGC